MSGVGTVREWMTRDPVVVPLEAPVGQVARRMRAERIRHVLVMDGERLAGIVSDRDVRGALVEGEPLPAVSTPVRRVMSDAPVTVGPDTPLTEAARAMLEHKIGALPVVDDDRVLGIVTESDALEALLLWAERAAR